MYCVNGTQDICLSSCFCDQDGATNSSTTPVDYAANVPIAFLMVTGAGLSTTFGAAAVFCTRCVTPRQHQILAASLGFSSGVMLYVSFVEIFQKSLIAFQACNCLWSSQNPDDAAYIAATLCFFGGIVVVYLLDALVHLISRHRGGGHGHSHNAPVFHEDKTNKDHQQPSSAPPPPATSSQMMMDDLALEDNGVVSLNETVDNLFGRKIQGEHTASEEISEDPSVFYDLENQMARRMPAHEESLKHRHPVTSESSSDDDDECCSQCGRRSANEEVEKDSSSHAKEPTIQTATSFEQLNVTKVEVEPQNVQLPATHATRGGCATRDSCACPHPEPAAVTNGHNHQASHGHSHELHAHMCSGAQIEQTLNLMSAEPAKVDKKLIHMGLMTALAIAIHNFPEGLATFVGALADPQVGGGLAVAIAIHNIPEGLCVAIPIYFATGSRWKAFIIAFLSGVTELIGAGIGYGFLMGVMSDAAYAVLFGLVAGMMVAIVSKELLPTAHRHDPADKWVTPCLFLGMVVIALSLVLFKV